MSSKGPNEPLDPPKSSISISEKEVQELFKGLPPEKINILISYIQNQVSSPPFPPPEVTEAFEKFYPGVTKVLIDHVIEEGKHRRGLESKQLEGEIQIGIKSLETQDRLGSKEIHTERYGISLAATACFAMLYLAYTQFVVGNLRTGLGIITAIAGVIGVFIWKRKEDNGPKEEMPEEGKTSKRLPKKRK